MKLPSSLVAALCALWLTPASGVDEATLGGNLKGLLDYAREHSPELAATRHEADAAHERADYAAALPDPVLRTELFDITNMGTTSPRMLPSQTGSTRYLLMQTVPWFGKRDLQREAADAQAAQAGGQVAASWADLASRIKQTYAMGFYSASSEQLTQETLLLLDGLEQIAQTRYANGLGAEQDVIRVQVEKTMLRSELIALQMDVHHAHTRLNALLSRPVDAALAEPLQRAIPPAANLDEAALQERMLARNPLLQIAEASIQSAEKNRELAYNNRYPGFTFGVAPNQYRESVRSWDLMIELNIPLQQSSRRAQERETEAMLSASSARKAAVLNEISSSLSESLAALEAARRTELLIATRLLPQAELTYQSALTGYETGKVDFAMLIEAERQVLKARQQRLQAQTDMQLRLADIEKLLGEEL